MQLEELKDHERELHRFRVRLGVAGAAVALAFGLLVARFVYLQVVQHAYYQTRAEDNRISLLPIPPNRGLILDRNGAVLARNFSAYTLEILPNKVHHIDRTIDALSRLIEITPRDRARFHKLLAETRGAESIPIRSRLSDEEVAKFAANSYRFPGVEIRARLFRRYPFGKLAAHVVGYMGRINPRDEERLEKLGVAANYRGTDFIGKAGIEASEEQALHGITGLEQVEIDAAGRAVRTLSRTPAQPGDNVALTLDVGLERVAEQAFGDREGALVAIEPSTGAVLALVSKPEFDPNEFVDGIDTANWDALNDSPKHPLTDRAIAGLYPPGSTIKPYLALAALQDGVRTEQQTIHDPGYFMFGGRRFRDDKRGGHGTVDMYKAIVESCDTYFYMLANDMGIDRIAKGLAPFGFGALTGIDLDGEVAGVLPSPQWKRRRFHQPWYPGDTISVGIGQGYNAYTPIEIAVAVATLANGGVMYRPHLVYYIDNPRTGERRYVTPHLVRRIHANPKYLAFIKHAMQGVTQNPDGTAAHAFAGVQYTVAGKTGTAQVVAMTKSARDYDENKVPWRFRDQSLFIAFAPVDNPRIALAVIVEHGGFGARAAAPIARAVLDYYLLGKLPKNPTKPVPVDETARPGD